jgi:hypothetical protein
MTVIRRDLTKIVEFLLVKLFDRAGEGNAMNSNRLSNVSYIEVVVFGVIFFIVNLSVCTFQMSW